MPSMRLPCAAAMLLFCCAMTAEASQDEAPRLTLAVAVERALANRPELDGFRVTQRIRQARREEAGLRPAPQLDLQLDDALGTGERSGGQVAETTLSFSQVLERGGKRAARERVADAEAQWELDAEAARQLDLIAEVARRFIDVLEGQLHYELAAEAVRIAEAGQAEVERRVQAARSPPAEAARAGVQLWNARLLLEDMDHELAIARRFLAAAMGEGEARFGRAQGELMTLPEPEDPAVLRARLERTPDLLVFASEERLRDAETRLAELRRRADPRVSLGVRRYEAGNDVALVAGISVPLFAARQAAPQVAAARARRERVSSEREALSLQLQSQLFAAVTQLEHEHHLSATLRDELLPRLEQALEQARHAYERGRFSHLEWTTAQRELLEGRQRLLESAARYHVLRVEIERLTGSALQETGANP